MKENIGVALAFGSLSSFIISTTFDNLYYDAKWPSRTSHTKDFKLTEDLFLIPLRGDVLYI